MDYFKKIIFIDEMVYMSQIDWKSYIDRSSLSDASKKMYKIQIDRMIEQTQKPLEWMLSHPREMLRIIQSGGYTLSTQRNRVSAICALLKHWPEAGAEFSQERDAWSAIQKELNKQNMERVLTGNPTEREIVNWVPWTKVIEAERHLRTTEYASWNHLMLAMYTHIEPIRADYGNVKLYFSEPVPDCTETNFMLVSTTKGKSFLCLNKYKTANRYGRFKRDLPESLVSIIRESVRQEPRDFLFMSTEGKPYTNKASFGKYANRVFHQIFKKHMTISLLRHSFISAIDYNSSRAKDLIAVSKNMQHSLGMQQYYRRSVPELEVALEETAPRPQGQRPKKTRHAPRDRRNTSPSSPSTDRRVIML